MPEVLPLLGRVLLGAVLLVAGWAKLRDRSGFAASVRGFGFVPRAWVGPVTIVLPLVELVCGALLLLGVAPGVAAVLAGSLLTVFTVGIGVNLRRGRTAPCACFGVGSARRLGPLALVRNLLLLLAAGAVLADAGSTPAPAAVDYLAAVLLAAMLTSGWQLLLTAHAVTGPARALTPRRQS